MVVSQNRHTIGSLGLSRHPQEVQLFAQVAYPLGLTQVAYPLGSDPT